MQEVNMDRPRLHWTPATWPPRVALGGRYVRLQPLAADMHGPDLAAAAGQPGGDAIWTFLGYGPFGSEAEHIDLLRRQANEEDPQFYAVVDAATDRAAGVTSYLRITPTQGVIEVGHIWFAPSLQRTRAATECLYLMIKPVFEDWGYRRLEWKCDAANAASRRAAMRFGFSFEGVFRQHMVVKDRNRDTAWFALLDRDWPAVRARFEAWLDPANFDDAGRQRRSLNPASG